jgi:hypothetical protein
MTLWGWVAKSGTLMAVSDSSTTVYNEYLDVVATGNGPNSPPSDIVHAVSGTTGSGGLVLTATNSASPSFTVVSSTLTGVVQRTWNIANTGGTLVWSWNDTSGSISPVSYGTSVTGITYQPASALASATSYSVITASINTENWCIDYSNTGFMTP